MSAGHHRACRRNWSGQVFQAKYRLVLAPNGGAPSGHRATRFSANGTASWASGLRRKADHETSTLEPRAAVVLGVDLLDHVLDMTLLGEEVRLDDQFLRCQP